MGTDTKKIIFVFNLIPLIVHPVWSECLFCSRVTSCLSSNTLFPVFAFMKEISCRLSSVWGRVGVEKEMFYLTTHSTHFVLWLSGIGTYGKGLLR